MKLIAGPQPITIEEYNRRSKPAKKEDILKIPSVKPPKRRGGFLVNKRRELANIKRIINSSPPPCWEIASKYWCRIDEIEAIIKAHVEIKKNFL